MKLNTREERNKKKFEKEFQARNAPLTDRYENSGDIRTIYNLFIIICVFLLIKTVIHDYIKTGRFNFGTRLIVLGFNKFHFVILIWCILNIFAFVFYLCFNVWANIRVSIKPKTTKLYDFMWVSAMIIYCFYSLYGIQKVVEVVGFSVCSSTILLSEQLRLLMKQYAFARTNISTVLNFKMHSDQNLTLPNFQKYLYFLFAPTFLYKDEYPRTQHNTRWKIVFYKFIELLAVIWFWSLTTERFIVPLFENVCLLKFSATEIVVLIVTNMCGGILMVLCAFYSVLHTTQIAFAEVLRFSDRMFYEEWWTSKTLMEYYRRWNVIVHEWLLFYVYRDFYEFLVPKNKTLSQIVVFILSAVFHEWILTNALNIFFPVLFISFSISGTVFTLLKIVNFPVGNVMIWFFLIFGSGLNVNLYALEFFARQNCPLEKNLTSTNFFAPRFITCDCVG